MRWFWIGVALALMLHDAVTADAQDNEPKGRNGPRDPQVFFDVKVPRPPVRLIKFRGTPVQLQQSAIDALRKGELPRERTEPGAPKQLPNDDDRFLRVSERGTVEIYPSFTALSKQDGDLDPDVLFAKVRERLTNNLLPKDKLSTTVLDYGRVVRRSQDESIGQRKLLYVSARRRIGNIPVDGPGSRFSIAFDAQGKVHSLLYDWSTLKLDQVEPMKRKSFEDPRRDIREQILMTQPAANVHVQSVELVYWDPGGEAEITPAYRFTAEIERTKKTLFTSEHLVGYAPLFEGQNLPRALVKNYVDEKAQPPLTHARAKPGEVLIGRFVVRDDSGGWWTAAEDFREAVSGRPSRLQFVDAAGRAIAATPEMFGARRAEYVNAVDVALVEAHGIPLGFTTKGDSDDPVFIEDIKLPGLGSRADGRLKHWIFHSCRAIPAPDDITTPWAKWWEPVFNGLSSVVGYHTPMFIADGVETPFGISLRAGAPVVPAWFNAVNALSIYGLDALARFQCEDLTAVGRAAAVLPCESGDNAANEEPSTPTKCLEVWWVENELLDLAKLGAQKP
jgi:hypothetical protein